MNGAELTTAGTLAGGSVKSEGRLAAWHASVLSIIVILGILGFVQILFVQSRMFREIFYLGYFIPIAIAAMLLSWRSAVQAAILSAVVYLLASTPVLVLSTQSTPELIAEVSGHVILFLAAGVGLSTYRLEVGREKEKALHAERERSDKLELMMDVSTTVSSSLKLEQVLQVLAVRIAEATEAIFCRISLLDESSENLKVVAVYPVRDMDWEPSIGRALPLDDLPDHKRAIKTREAVLVGGRQQISEKGMNGHQNESVCDAASLLLYPLVVGDKAVGVVSLGEQRKWEKNPLTYEKTAICQTIVNQGAKAVAHALTHQDLEEAFLGTVRSLAEAIDAKDPSTHGHSDWVSRYAVMIGRQMQLSEKDIDELRYAGYLHDVGKIGISDGILGKPSHLTTEQWKLMKMHTIMGDRILEPVRISPMIKAAVRHHHERFDGKGYPDGRAGEDIPLSARILSVADAYEAMTSDRPYRKALSDEQAMGELRRYSGAQFDPLIVEAFLTVLGGPYLLAGRASQEALAS